jgi:catechol 2,3-dioxygenase-like lactoylglutathione lyase family enzyme
VTYAVDDESAIKKYFAAKGVEFTEQSEPNRKKGHTLSVVDPEGHKLVFVQHPTQPRGPRIVHAGFIVRDRAGMEHFYQDILGFRPYWHGGMKDGETDWVSLQVPDGTDWVEFMVNVPEIADQRLRGIMNHIALGVPDIQQAREQLVKKGVHLTEEPKLGRDGKWQLNLYDPDQTRIEFMEFTPKEKPCCSEFTGPHPKP